jgi:hypothetical protein
MLSLIDFFYNVIFKFVAKAYTIRLAPVAHRTIDTRQTAFPRGDACMRVC